MYFCSMLRVVVVSGGGCREPLKGATLLSGRVHVMDCHEVVQSIRKSNKQPFDYELKLAKVKIPEASLFFASQKIIFSSHEVDLTSDLTVGCWKKPLEVWDAIAELAEIVGDAAPQGAGETQFCQGWNLSKTGMVRFTKSGEGFFMNACILEVIPRISPKLVILFIFNLDWL